MNINFSKLNGLVPAIIQDYASKNVLMLGFMNENAYQQTVSEGKVTFFSRTKNRLWTKGEESGNFLYVKDIQIDCDNDTLLILASPEGPVCHTGNATCFSAENRTGFTFLKQLEDIIAQRALHPVEGSYTNTLLQKGIDKIAQKVGEEAVEVIIDAKNDTIDSFKGEVADLLYHLLVLLQAKGVCLDDIGEVLAMRHR
jgi:phosphoribosyl-ATP pyrophosphohydrolase/phosphoribosyl-AMP cyclohydrolase